MTEKLENSLIFNNHFVVAIYDKWEEKIDIGKYTDTFSKAEKSILYLFWEKIVFERYQNVENEVPIVLNNILRILRLNKHFKQSLIDRIVYFINIKELDNDFDFMGTLSVEFDDILTYLEKEFELFVARTNTDEYVVFDKEQLTQELSHDFSRSITYPK